MYMEGSASVRANAADASPPRHEPCMQRMYYSMLYSTILYSTLLYSTLLYSIILYSIIL